MIWVLSVIIAPQKAVLASAGREDHTLGRRAGPVSDRSGDVSLGMSAEPAPQCPANLSPLDPLVIVAGFERCDYVVA